VRRFSENDKIEDDEEGNEDINKGTTRRMATNQALLTAGFFSM
jgi:hypothetical protein